MVSELRLVHAEDPWSGHYAHFLAAITDTPQLTEPVLCRVELKRVERQHLVNCSLQSANSP